MRPLGVGDRLALAGRGDAVGPAQVHGDLDLVVPVVLHRADLLVQQERAAAEEAGHEHGEDDRDREPEVAAEPVPDFGEDHFDAHGVWVS